MSEDSQLWSILLWLTDGTPQMQLQYPDQLLQIHKAGTGKNVQINNKTVFNPHKTLGHYKAPEGTGRSHKICIDPT
eukprot:9912853-Ditylum_brightwellii.AAC.1